MTNHSNKDRDNKSIETILTTYLRNRGITRIAIEYETVLCVEYQTIVNGRSELRKIRSTFYHNNIDYTILSFHKQGHLLDSMTKDYRVDKSLVEAVKQFISDKWPVLIGAEVL